MFARPGLCGMGIGRLGLMSASQATLLQQAIAAIRRNNGTLFYVPQNALGDGAPNLLSAPEFAGGLTDAPTRDGLITASTMTGYDGAIAFGHGGSASSYAYKTFTPTVGLTYTISVIVKMDDGLAPTFGNAARAHVSNTFALVANGGAMDPTTYTVSLQSDGSYRVSGAIAATSGAINTGVVKYVSNDNRTFKVTGYKLEQGSTATAYTPQSVLRNRGVFIDSAGVSPVTNIADVIGRMTDRAGGSAVATQATTANKPTVQTNPQGRYVVRFDGGNDSLTTNITTGNEGWICAGLNFAVLNKSETIFCSGGTSDATKGVWLIKLVSGIRIGIANGTSTVTAITAAIAANTQTCIEGYWDASSVSAQVNGGTVYSNARTGSATPTSAAKIGTTLSDAFPIGADMSAMVVCQTLPSAADRAIIRKWIGSLQGQVL